LLLMFLLLVVVCEWSVRGGRGMDMV